MESPVIKIMLIAAGIAAAAAVVTVMWTQLASNTEEIDNTSTNAYTLATSRTLCEALGGGEGGHWWRQLASSLESKEYTKDQSDEIWAANVKGKCAKKGVEPDGITKATDKTVLTGKTFAGATGSEPKEGTFKDKWVNVTLDKADTS